MKPKLQVSFYFRGKRVMRMRGCFQHLGCLNALKNPDLKHFFSAASVVFRMPETQPYFCSLASYRPLSIWNEALQPSPAWFCSVDGVWPAHGTLEGNVGCRWTLYCSRAASDRHSPLTVAMPYETSLPHHPKYSDLLIHLIKRRNMHSHTR